MKATIKSIDNLSNRLGRLEISQKNTSSSTTDSNLYSIDSGDIRAFATVEDWFNWRIQNILPSYKAYVIQYHNISSDEEYSRRVLEGDQSIYLPQPNPKFEATWYKERVANVLNLDYQGVQELIKRGEIEDKIGTGRMVLDPKTGEYTTWLDENPVVF